MEPVRATYTNRARFACATVAGALALGLLTLLAGPAKAGPEIIRGLDDEAVHAAVAKGLTEVERGLESHGRELRRERARAAARAKAERESGLGEVENAAGEPIAVTGDACEANVALAASKGLRLPDGWKMHCVGPGLDWNGGSHWGVTCPYEECPEGAGPYVSISNPTYYVVAHELCHANFGNDELMADRCAAKHGASLETSPYS